MQVGFEAELETTTGLLDRSLSDWARRGERRPLDRQSVESGAQVAARDAERSASPALVEIARVDVRTVERTRQISSMKGDGWSSSKCSAAWESRTLGAKGRKSSRRLTTRLRRSRMPGCLG